jgi:hypothetical protein
MATPPRKTASKTPAAKAGKTAGKTASAPTRKSAAPAAAKPATAARNAPAAAPAQAPRQEARPPASISEPLTGEARYRWIAHAAYLRAEKRGFAPGHEIDDWLAAEAEFEAANRAAGG